MSLRFILYPSDSMFSEDTREDTPREVIGVNKKRQPETRKPAQGGLFRGASSHVGTCGNLHLVEPGGFEPPSASSPLLVLHA